MKRSTLIPMILIPVLSLITGLILLPTYVDSKNPDECLYFSEKRTEWIPCHFDEELDEWVGSNGERLEKEH